MQGTVLMHQINTVKRGSGNRMEVSREAAVFCVRSEENKNSLLPWLLKDFFME